LCEQDSEKTLEKSYDILIVGGGIIGSSIAMALSDLGLSDIAVVDCDLSGKWGSSERNAGGIRAVWEQEVNVGLSKKSIAFYASHAEEIGFQQNGYLWLCDSARENKMDSWRDHLEHFEYLIESLTPLEIAKRFPFIDRLDGVSMAFFSPKDGLINPNLLKNYYRDQTSQAQVDWIDNHVLEEVTLESGRVSSVQLRALSSEDEVEHFLVDQMSPKGGCQTQLAVKTLINAAGSWAPCLARLYDKEIPSLPVRRQVSVLHCQDLDLSSYGMIVDTTGLYFHPEAGNLLAGYAVPTEAAGFCFEFEGDGFFMTEIWPRLAARSSHFDRLKQVGGWAGLYAVSPDNSAIIGSVPGRHNILEAHSFSGHGVMQSYAVGQGIAEWVLTGAYQTLDLSMLSGDRFERGRPVVEGLLI